MSVAWDRLGEAVRADQRPALQTLATDHRLKIRARVLAEPTPRSRSWWLVTPVLVAAALALWLVLPPPAAGPAHWEATAAAHTIHFDDGSTVTLQPGAVLTATDATGPTVHLALEHGQAHLQVHPDRDTDWTVDAGAYSVHVTGTAFDLAVDGSDMELDLHEGTVDITGPDGVVSLQAGETFPPPPPPPARPVLATRQPAPPAPTPELQAPAADVEPRPAPRARPRHRAPRPADKSKPEPDWKALARAGNWTEAMAALEQIGLAEVESAAPARDLLRAADVARVSRNGAAALRLFRAARHRFPGSDEAAEAAFGLGRLAASAGAHEKAATWWSRYLKERPRGALARQALARRMEAHARAGNASAARADAARYLDEYPRGPDVARAKELLP